MRSLYNRGRWPANTAIFRRVSLPFLRLQQGQLLNPWYIGKRNQGFLSQPPCATRQSSLLRRSAALFVPRENLLTLT